MKLPTASVVFYFYFEGLHQLSVRRVNMYFSIYAAAPATSLAGRGNLKLSAVQVLYTTFLTQAAFLEQ